MSHPVLERLLADPNSWDAFRQQWETQYQAQRHAPRAATPAFNPPSGGSWTSITGPSGGTVMLSNPLLLTDGTVIAHASCTSSWYRLTPDINGSYVNGSWSTIASLPTGYTPRFFASAVLPDGRVLIEGGEYNGGSCTEVFTKKGALYDPVANAWTSVTAMTSWHDIGDAESIVLANGTFMLADCCDAGPLAATFNEQNLTWTSTGSKKADHGYDEEGWTLLPNGNVLTVDAYVDGGTCSAMGSEQYAPATGQWSSAGSTTVQLPDCTGKQSFEMGPQVLRPDGTVVAFGGTTTGATNTAIFDSGSGIWTAGLTVPTVTDANDPPSCPAACPYTLADAPAALLPNGNILFAASPSDWKTSGSFFPPTHFFELAAADNTMSQVADADPANTASLNSFDLNFLVLPTGEVLLMETDAGGIAVYDPSPGGPGSESWRPVITSALPSPLALGTTYQITGTQFNGLSQGAVYGDDVQASTNYPLVRITNNATGHVFYAKTFGFTTMSVAPSASGTTSFTLAANTESGPSQLVVIANGIASSPANVTINGLDTLTVSKSGNGGGAVTSSPSGINCGATCSANFTAGQPVTLTAAATSGSFFGGWSGGGCSGIGTCAVTMNAAVAVTATFDPGSVLTVSESGNGVLSTSGGIPAAINCGTSCSAGFSSGAVVTVNEAPATGWTFHGWGGACGGTGTCQVTMNLPEETVSAIFTATSRVAGNTWILTCNDNSSDNLNGAVAGSADWTFPSTTGRPGAGDIILLNGICLGDVAVATADLTFTNHNDTNPADSAPPSSAAGFIDGIDGQLEFAAGAAASTARNLLLEAPGSFSGGESANLYVHDGGAVTIWNSWIGPGPLDGILVQGAPSTANLLNSTVNGNGTAAVSGAANGARVIDAASLVLGAPDGSNGSMISGNANGFGIALRGNTSAELDASTVAGNGLGQIDATVSSSVLAAGTLVSQSSAANPAIQAIGRSSLALVALGSGTGDSIGGGSAGAVLAAGNSSVVLNDAAIQSSSIQQPAIEASVTSSIVLAGGNNICAGSLSGSACTPLAGGTAIEVDHSSSLLHQQGKALGFGNGAESITGKGVSLMESSMELGQGPVGGAFGLVWNGGIAVGQNSALRMQSGVQVTGAVQISAASNGYFNCNNNGNSCSGAGAQNEIDGTVACLELVAGPDNPSVHVSNPPLTVNSSQAAGSGIVVANLFGASGFANTSEPANTCLNF
ncbi:MAG TPA: hypothetical protein VGP48_02825 [Stellaceae bacterium]|nr:hypothetical protein [Stellaceae bacterium]